MKKLFIVACFITTLSATAQNDPRFTIGSKFSYGHSYIMPYGGGFSGSWAVGLNMTYMSGEHLGFGGDILYSAEGGRIELIDGTGANANIEYMRVPLRVIYALGTGAGNFRPRIAAGPTFGVNLREGTGYRDMDFGFNASAGFSYKMLEGLWLGIDAAYYHGLIDIYDDVPVNERNGNIRLDVSITFGL